MITDKIEKPGVGELSILGSSAVVLNLG